MSVTLLLQEGDPLAALTHWAIRFACASDYHLHILLLGEGEGDELVTPLDWATEEVGPKWMGPTREVIRSEFLRLSQRNLVQASEGDDESLHPDAKALDLQVTHIETATPLHSALSQIQDAKTQLLILGKQESSRTHGAHSKLAREIFRRAACSTLLMRCGEEAHPDCDRILVPAGGGPHADEALKWGHDVVTNVGGTLVPFYVEPDTDEVSRDVGESRLQRILKKAGIGEGDAVLPRVMLGRDVSSAIREEATEGYDLILMGNPNLSSLRKMLFGTILERTMSENAGTSIGVLRKARPMVDRLRRRLEHWLDLNIPQVERQERIQLFEYLETNARWNFDFLALIGLSTIIAGIGLLQDSAAVVIGAMLVAPLMTPLLGAGLALVQVHGPLMRRSVKAICFGFLAAFIISFVLGYVVPLPGLSDELQARGAPTILDMGVAFFSGLAAAYCVGRPNLSAALPGVAIAAALVPPIATAGVSVSRGAMDNATGALILFFTNVVAVIIGAAISFYAGGIRGKLETRKRSRWVWLVNGLLAVSVLGLSIPLSKLLLKKFQSESVPINLKSSLTPAVAEMGYTLDEVRVEYVQDQGEGRLRKGLHEEVHAKMSLELYVEGDHAPDQQEIVEFSRIVSDQLEQPVALKVYTTLVSMLPADQSEQRP